MTQLGIIVPAFDRPSVDSPAKALDLARLREEFPQTIKTWNQMNIAERAASMTARRRQAAGL